MYKCTYFIGRRKAKMLIEGEKSIDMEGTPLARRLLNATRDEDHTSLDLEGAVVRSLALLTAGDPEDFCDYAEPPRNISAWLCQAEIEPVRGLLMSSLRRWHELQQRAEHP